MVTSRLKYGYNPEPRLSANQMAEYFTATPPRRKSIVREAKFPKGLIVASYEEAKIAISKHLCSPTRDPQILLSAIEKLGEREARASGKSWMQQDCRISVEAIQALQKSCNKLGLGGLNIKSVAPNQPNLEINSVRLSISLDAMIIGRDKAGNDRVGGLILFLLKTEPSTRLREARCKMAAILALVFAEEHLSQYGGADPKITFSLDVFSGLLVQASANSKRIREQILISCEEVALRWLGTEPPIDYDGPPH